MLKKLNCLLLVISIIALAGCKISGTVTENSVGIEGITMTLEGDESRTLVTDEKGKYKFKKILRGTYTITPSAEGYQFEPESTTITQEQFTREGTKVNFVAIKNTDSEVKCSDDVWEGDYVINDIEDIDNLSGYTEITGTLTIENMSTIDGLQCLTTIGGMLLIKNNDTLDLEGLNNLETISLSLIINSNTYLEDILSGLNMLTYVGGFTSIANNPNLPESQVQDLLDQLEY